MDFTQAAIYHFDEEQEPQDKEADLNKGIPAEINFLNLKEAEIRDEDLRKMQYFPNEIMNSIGGLRNLRVLRLPKIEISSLSPLCNSAIERLDLSGSKLPRAWIEDISRMFELQILDLYGCRLYSSFHDKMDGDNVSFNLRPWEKLLKLRLVDCSGVTNLDENSITDLRLTNPALKIIQQNFIVMTSQQPPREIVRFFKQPFNS